MKKILLVIFLSLPIITLAADQYNLETGVLHMPKVMVGSENYEVEMLHQGNLVFNVTKANPLNAQASSYSGEGYDLAGAGTSDYTYELNLVISGTDVSGTLTMVEGSETLGTFNLQHGSFSNDLLKFHVIENGCCTYSFSLFSVENGFTGGVTELSRGTSNEFSVSGFTYAKFNRI